MVKPLKLFFSEKCTNDDLGLTLTFFYGKVKTAFQVYSNDEFVSESGPDGPLVLII